MIVLSFNLQGSFFFNEYLLEAKRLERSQEGEKGGVVYAWAEYYLQPAFWLLGRYRLCHSWALLGSVTSPGGTRQLFSRVCSENEARENALNWLGWFAFKEFLIDDIAHEQTIICREGFKGKDTIWYLESSSLTAHAGLTRRATAGQGERRRWVRGWEG